MSSLSNSEQRSTNRGFAVAGSFGSWGSILWITPTYVQFSGTGQWICYILGGLCVAISFLGALQELSRLLGSEAFSWWGVAFVFLIPALLLHLIAYFFSLSPFWTVATKGVALLLDAVGVPFIFFGFATYFDEAAQQKPKSPEQKSVNRRNTARTILAFVSAVLPPIVAGIAEYVFS